MLELKETAIKMLQEEVGRLQEVLPEQLQVEDRFRQLAELVEPGEELGGKLLDKIGDAVKAAKGQKVLDRVYSASLAASFDGYPEFESQLPYAIDKLGAQKHGIRVPEPEQPKEKGRWLYD